MLVDDGRLQISPRHLPLPDPIHDEDMVPFWRKSTEDEKRYAGSRQLEFLNFDKMERYDMPSIHIEGLCGYCWTPERYKEEASKLLSYGFTLMRSQRDERGQYGEMWSLSSLIMAEGALQNELEELKSKDDRELLKRALDFLGRTVSFGSLDVCVQRMAMPNPD